MGLPITGTQQGQKRFARGSVLHCESLRFVLQTADCVLSSGVGVLITDVAVTEADEGLTTMLKASDFVNGIFALRPPQPDLDVDERRVAAVLTMVLGQG